MQLYILSSNAYVHVIPGFCHFFNKFWGDKQAVTFVGYDIRPKHLPRNFTWWSMGQQVKTTWSEGVIRLLSLIDDDLFILGLEDYWLSRPVVTSRVEQLWDYMEANPDVAKIDLTDDLSHRPCSVWDDPDAPPDILVANSYSDFQASVQMAIWRKDFMRRFLEPSENAWQWEKKGTKRMIAARDRGSLNQVILASQSPPVAYVNAIGGEGTHPQEWATKRFPAWMWSEAKAHGLVT